MKSNRFTCFALILSCILMFACSSEGKLVGEWQSTTPESGVHLTIALKGTDDAGFHGGFTQTRDGQQYSEQYWSISEGDRGTILWLSQGMAATAGSQGRPGSEIISGSAIRHKVTELSSNRLVLNWDHQGGNTGVYEFKRVR